MEGEEAMTLDDKIIKAKEDHPEWSQRKIAAELNTYRFRVRKVLVAPKPKPISTQRICLRCGEKFRSKWVGNRICRVCTHLNSKEIAA